MLELLEMVEAAHSSYTDITGTRRCDSGLPDCHTEEIVGNESLSAPVPYPCPTLLRARQLATPKEQGE